MIRPDCDDIDDPADDTSTSNVIRFPAASTVQAIEYLEQLGDVEQMRSFLARFSRAERQLLRSYFDKKRGPR